MRAREGASVHGAAVKSKVPEWKRAREPAKFSSRDNQDGTGGIRRDGDCFRSRDDATQRSLGDAARAAASSGSLRNATPTVKVH